jgi:hypothetical protein
MRQGRVGGCTGRQWQAQRRRATARRSTPRASAQERLVQLITGAVADFEKVPEGEGAADP